MRILKTLALLVVVASFGIAFAGRGPVLESAQPIPEHDSVV